MKQPLKFLLLMSIAAVMVGCKLAVIVVEGGKVRSTRSGFCRSICVVDVSDPYFSDTFGAVPDEGWYFQKWNLGSGFFCSGSTEPTCPLSFEGHEESEVVEEMVASSELFYLMPVFKPRKDNIAVNGKEWLQPDLFLGLSWNEINAVCPAGRCSGVLNGHDMNGWTWASVNDIKALFNYYVGTNELGPGTDFFWEVNSEWAPTFFSDGWMDTDLVPQLYIKAVEGLLRDLRDDESAYEARILYIAHTGDDVGYDRDRVDIFDREVVAKVPDIGAWFYRTPLQAQL